MATRSSPINIANKPYSSFASPRQQQTSNLTTALHSTTGNGRRPSNAANAMTSNGRYMGNGNGSGRHDSFGASSGLGPYSGGAQPISMNRNQQRRESMAGSMANGMSWGGVSVGSWIRDDVIMQGTSPFPHKSPSYHSSSYMPKLEAAFMRDFLCCGIVLATLHDLLQHYEESHVPEADLFMLQRQSQQNLVPPDPKAAIAMNTAATIQQQAPPRQQQLFRPSQQSQVTSSQKPSIDISQLNQTYSSNTRPVLGQNYQSLQFGMNNYQNTMAQSNDVDVADDMDMEMDDFPASNLGGMNVSSPMQGMFVPISDAQTPQRTQFGQAPVSRVPPLDMQALNYGGGLQSHMGLKNSQPGTPISGGLPRFVNNPTVSSVNTPTLSAHPKQPRHLQSPNTSVPGTPGELDPDFVGFVGNMSVVNNTARTRTVQPPFETYDIGPGDMRPDDEALNPCIDDPAQRLSNLNGGMNSGPPMSHRMLGSTQYGPDSELARRIRDQQKLAGLPDTMSGPNNEEPKPFRCPVIGCEKAYKNQNGLKYHKGHGHNNQRLHENADGTYSIVNPETSVPYPGTEGMQKEKPYKCDTCGKRYKNLNGLKYHRSHTQACNSDLPRSETGAKTKPQEVNIAGAAN